MKKTITYAVITMLVLALTLTGCSSSKSVKTYLEENREEIEAAVGNLESQGMSMEIEATEDTLIYNVTLEESMVGAATKEDLSAAFETALEGMGTAMKPLAQTIADELKLDEVKISMEYFMPNGDSIIAKEFSNK